MTVTLVRRRRPPCVVHIFRDGYYDGVDAPYRCLLCGALAADAELAQESDAETSRRPTLVVLPGGRVAPDAPLLQHRRRHG